MNMLWRGFQAMALCAGGLTLAACSCTAEVGGGSDNEGGTGGDVGGSGGVGGSPTGGTGNTSGSGGTPGGSGGAPGGAGGALDAGATVTLSGLVVDASTGTGWDKDDYTVLADVEVCAEGLTDVACVATELDGTYAIEVPAGTDVVLTFVKDGYYSTRYAMRSGAADSTVQFVLMPSDAQVTSSLGDVNVPENAGLGLIYFGAITPSENTAAPFYQEWGGNGFEYVADLTVSISPAADHGPFFAGTDWTLDSSLTASTAAGWGVFYTEPGTYSLNFTHPTLDCGGTFQTTVVAAFATTYVGLVCTPPETDGGAGDGGTTDGGSGPADAGAD